MNIVSIFEDGERRDHPVVIRFNKIYSLPKLFKRDGERPVEVEVEGTKEEKAMLLDFSGLDKYVILLVNHHVHPIRGKQFNSIEEFVYGR